MLFERATEDATENPVKNNALVTAGLEAYAKGAQVGPATTPDTTAAVLPKLTTTEIAWNEPPRNMTANERWQYEHMSRDEQWRYNNMPKDQQYTRDRLNSREQYDYDRMTPRERDDYDRRRR